MVARALAPPGREYKYQRFAQYGNISTSTTVTTNFAWSFLLSDLPNYTEFTTLYDQYRIEKIELILISNTSESIPSSVNLGVMYKVTDYDDATTLSTNLDYLQYQNCKVLNPLFHKKSFPLKPRFAVAAYAGAFTSYANNAGWLDVASPSVQHYGVKIGFSATTVVISYQVLAKFHLSFKNPR